MPKTKITPEKWIKWGIPVIFVAGSALHFAYDALGKNPAVGMLCPVSESIWEHTKLAYLPNLLWWGGYYIKNRQGINGEKWLKSAVCALLVCMATVPIGYYFYTGAFCEHFLVADISLFALAVVLAQALGLHIYKKSRRGISLKLAAAVYIAVAAIFALWTVYPPDLPMFRR